MGYCAFARHGDCSYRLKLATLTPTQADAISTQGFSYPDSVARQVELEGARSQVANQLAFDFFEHDRCTTQSAGLISAPAVPREARAIRRQLPGFDALVRKSPQVDFSCMHSTPASIRRTN
jgi:hypothetical protein